MRKRNCRVEVCFTKDELTVLSKKAKKAGLSIGGFVRHSVADKEIKEAPPADIPLLLRAMRQAGYNLDQTLKRFNTTNGSIHLCEYEETESYRITKMFIDNRQALLRQLLAE